MTLENEITKIKKTLEEHEERIKLLESMIPELKSERIKPVEGIGDFKKLAQKINVDVEKIQELFDIEDDTLTLLKKIEGANDREKTQKISLMVLLGYKYLLGKLKVLAIEVRRNVAENKIPVNNFATYLNEIIPSLIRRIGKPKSPKTTYKLTPLGEAEAKEMLKELCA